MYLLIDLPNPAHRRLARAAELLEIDVHVLAQRLLEERVDWPSPTVPSDDLDLRELSCTHCGREAFREETCVEVCG